MAQAAVPAPASEYFARNVAGISLVELLWGLGLPVVSDSTFLPLFMLHLGASNLLVGLAPTLSSAGTALASLLAYALTAHLKRKRRAMMALHMLAAAPLLAIGVLLLGLGIRPSTLTVFLLAYAAFALGIGLLLPVWQNYTVKIFTDRRTVSALGIMMVTQSVARLAGSLYLARLVERYSFSAAGSGLVFTLVGGLFFVGSFPFLLTVEDAVGVAPSPVPAPHWSSIRAVLANRAYRSFLATDLEYFSLTVVIAFYAGYATEFGGIDPAVASGLFVALACAGGVAANGVLGWANVLGLRGKYLLAKSLALAGVLLLASGWGQWTFFVASVLVGLSRGTRGVVLPAAIKRISGQPDATLYFSLAPVLLLPISLGLPLVSGLFLDAVRSLGARSYQLMFLAMACLAAAGLYFSSRIPAEPRRKEAQ
ncbi:MAG TPA: MFS transporter [bacterium]|nr:MFS transporter [bacterium]